MLVLAVVAGPTSTTTAEGTTTTTGIDLGLVADTEVVPAMATVISGTPSALAGEVTPPTEVEAS